MIGYTTASPAIVYWIVGGVKHDKAQYLYFDFSRSDHPSTSSVKCGDDCCCKKK